MVNTCRAQLHRVAGEVQEGTFTNPILAGFHPDPSICRVGDDFYLVTSTFAYYPGIPVFHSRDLVSWSLVGHVLDSPEVLNLEGQGVSRGIFAPAIRFHDGLFYVTCTLVDIGGNFIATAEHPGGPWSPPVWLPAIDGIDPSPFFDDERAYIVYNSVPPDRIPLYDGHRTIRLREIDLSTLQLVGQEKILVNGGTDIAKHPVWIEGPHIFKRNGYYYLIAAEGGTGDQHSEVVFRSSRVDGPYTPGESNPILTQRNLTPGRDHPITSTGHADFVQTAGGDWWAVFLGCRPYQPYAEGYYNTGRETFLAPVVWKAAWPEINPGHVEVQYRYSLPLSRRDTADIPRSGNFTIRDDFDPPSLDHNWMFLRTPYTQWYTTSVRPGFLVMNLLPATCGGSTTPAFVAMPQQHQTGSATASVGLTPATDDERAGLLVFQNETHYFFLSRTTRENAPAVALFRGAPGDSSILIASQRLDRNAEGREIVLQLLMCGNTYSFRYATSPGEWKTLRDNVDATYLSTRVAGGFVGCMIGLYATSTGVPTTAQAFFDWFEYSGNDEVYK